jgi:hypothetical protein
MLLTIPVCVWSVDEQFVVWYAASSLSIVCHNLLKRACLYGTVSNVAHCVTIMFVIQLLTIQCIDTLCQLTATTPLNNTHRVKQCCRLLVVSRSRTNKWIRHRVIKVKYAKLRRLMDDWWLNIIFKMLLGLKWPRLHHEIFSKYIVVHVAQYWSLPCPIKCYYLSSGQPVVCPSVTWCPYSALWWL